MFEPLSGFTNTNCTGRTHKHTHKLFLHEKPQFVSVKGTTKKADAFGLFVYPNYIDAQPRGGNRQTAKGFCILYSFRFVVEHFESVYQLRMRVYIYAEI